MTEPEILRGGVANAGAVVRVGSQVLRPANQHTPTIHALLRYVRARGFDGVPEPIGTEPSTEPPGRERLGFIVGDVAVPPFPQWVQTDHALASAARLLRGFHDSTLDFTAPPDATWSDEMADPLADEASAEQLVICHNDVCPENVVYRNGDAVALLDFDFAAPGRRVFDLAAFARMFVPIDTDADAARFGRGGLDAVARLVVVADAYGLTEHRGQLVEALSLQLAQGGAFVQRRADAGEEAFREMLEQMGGVERYERRRQWFDANRDQFLDALG